MNWALFRKDLRLFRVPFVAGLVTVAGTYGVGAIVALGMWSDASRDTASVAAVAVAGEPGWRLVAAKEAVPGVVMVQALMPAALVGLGLSAFLAASVGGAAFAAERRERSADFLAMLPVPRWRIAASKMLAALACLLVPCAVHLAVIFLVPALHDAPSRSAIRAGFEPVGAGAGYALAMTLMLFGLAWLLSSFLDSTALAATTAIGLGMLGVAAAADFLKRSFLARGADLYAWSPSEAAWALIDPAMHGGTARPILETIQTCAAVFGALALVAGTVIYVRRVAP